MEDPEIRSRCPRHRAERWTWNALGGLFVAIAAIGIVLPLVPTTGPLLLAAAAFGRGSPAAYRWLHENRWFGEHLRNYREKRTLPAHVRWTTLVVLWGTIAVSLWMLESTLVRGILICVAIGVTLHVAWVGRAGEERKAVTALE